MFSPIKKHPQQGGQEVQSQFNSNDFMIFHPTVGGGSCSSQMFEFQSHMNGIMSVYLCVISRRVKMHRLVRLPSENFTAVALYTTSILKT